MDHPVFATNPTPPLEDVPPSMVDSAPPFDMNELMRQFQTIQKLQAYAEELRGIVSACEERLQSCGVKPSDLPVELSESIRQSPDGDEFFSSFLPPGLSPLDYLLPDCEEDLHDTTMSNKIEEVDPVSNHGQDPDGGRPERGIPSDIHDLLPFRWGFGSFGLPKFPASVLDRHLPELPNDEAGKGKEVDRGCTGEDLDDYSIRPRRQKDSVSGMADILPFRGWGPFGPLELPGLMKPPRSVSDRQHRRSPSVCYHCAPENHRYVKPGVSKLCQAAHASGSGTQHHTE